VYSGRTSGYGDPNALVQARGLQQPILTGEGFSPAVLDQGVSVQQNPNAYAAIRGREQQLIDFNGGAQSMGGDIKKHDQRHIEYKSAQIVLQPAINQPIWSFARQLAWGSWTVTDGWDARRI